MLTNATEGASLLPPSVVSLFDDVLSILLAVAAYLVVSRLMGWAVGVAVDWLQSVAKKTESKADDEVVAILEREQTCGGLRGLGYRYLVLFLSATVLRATGTIDREVVRRMAPLAQSVLVVLAATLAWEVIMVFAMNAMHQRDTHRSPKEAEKNFNMAQNLCGVLHKCYLFILALFVLENFMGLQVTALVSIGSIGGLALALSTQAVLQDLVAAFIFFLDQPFKVGDLIQVMGTDTTGVVEAIGFRHTKLIHPDGEVLIIANQGLSSSKLKILTTVERRRLVSPWRLCPSTTAEQLRQLPGVVEAAVAGVPDCTHCATYMKEHLGWAYLVEVIWYGHGMDIHAWRRAQHAVQVNIAEALDAHGIQVAAPPWGTLGPGLGPVPSTPAFGAGPTR
eukprot:EG_transcript_9877